jgi:hypothetical protein
MKSDDPPNVSVQLGYAPTPKPSQIWRRRIDAVKLGMAIAYCVIALLVGSFAAVAAFSSLHAYFDERTLPSNRERNLEIAIQTTLVTLLFYVSGVYYLRRTVRETRRRSTDARH